MSCWKQCPPRRGVCRPYESFHWPVSCRWSWLWQIGTLPPSQNAAKIFTLYTSGWNTRHLHTIPLIISQDVAKSLEKMHRKKRFLYVLDSPAQNCSIWFPFFHPPKYQKIKHPGSKPLLVIHSGHPNMKKFPGSQISPCRLLWLRSAEWTSQPAGLSRPGVSNGGRYCCGAEVIMACSNDFTSIFMFPLWCGSRSA